MSEEEITSLVMIDRIKSCAEDANVAFRGQRGSYWGFATRPIDAAPSLPNVETRLKYLQPKIHISLSATDRLRFFERVVEKAHDIGLKAWKMKNLSVGRSEASENGLADFVFYTQNSYGIDDDTVLYVKTLVRELDGILNKMNAEEVETIPRFSVGIEEIDGRPIHSAITLSQGSGVDKALLPNGYLEKFDARTGNALTKDLADEYEDHSIKLKYINV